MDLFVRTLLTALGTLIGVLVAMLLLGLITRPKTTVASPSGATTVGMRGIQATVPAVPTNV